MKIDFANLQLQYQKYQADIDLRIQEVLNKSNYIMGQEITELEEQFQKFTGAQYAISCSSGTDALLLAMMALDIKPGDEIITSPFTFISTAETIAFMKAKPVFVDIEPDTFNIDAKLIKASITDRTKAIMPVSLFGQPADMDTIQDIANEYKLKVIIDGTGAKGSLKIAYENLDQLDAVIALLRGEGAAGHAPGANQSAQDDVTDARPESGPKLSVSLKPKSATQ